MEIRMEYPKLKRSQRLQMMHKEVDIRLLLVLEELR